MKLHWSPRSPFVRKVAVAAYEKGIDDQIERVRSVVPTDDFEHPIFEDNPLGKIPTLVTDDGLTWFGSSVVLERMDLLCASPAMFPADAKLRVETRCREALGDGIMELMIGWITERYNPSKRTEVVLARSSNKLMKSLDQLERSIERYHQLDAGSISVACALSYIDFRFSEIKWREGRPRMRAWHEEFSQRPSMLKSEFKDG